MEYNKGSTAEQWVKGRQAGRQDDTVELASVPLEPGVAQIERVGVQPEKLVPMAVNAEEDRELVVDGSAETTAKTGGRLARQAGYFWLLLAEGHLNRRRFAAMLAVPRCCCKYEIDRWCSRSSGIRLNKG